MCKTVSSFMDAVCPRCHALLGPDAHYCAECGAPQLTVEVPAPESGEDASAEAHTLGGSQIAWPKAIGAAAILAVPVGVLSSLISFSTLWVLAGGVWTISLYRRRAAAPLSATLGSRIGVVFGVFAAVISTFADALNMLVTRYGLHRGAEIDTRLRAAMQAGIDWVTASNPDAVHQIPWFFHFWLSPEGQAGLVLASAVLSGASMLGFSALGGALGARWMGARRAWGK